MAIVHVAHGSEPIPGRSASIASSTFVTKVTRKRLTVDLRDLASALKASAKAGRLTMSEAARLAIAAALDTAMPALGRGEVDDGDALADNPVKLTIRLRRDSAARLAARARTSGLSLGSYVTTLIDGTPAPPLPVVSALNASTDQLAAIAGDLNHFVRLHCDRSTPAGTQVDQITRRIMEDLRHHLDLAARIVADLRPARAHANQRRLGAAGRRA